MKKIMFLVTIFGVSGFSAETSRLSKTKSTSNLKILNPEEKEYKSKEEIIEHFCKSYPLWKDPLINKIYTTFSLKSKTEIEFSTFTQKILEFLLYTILEKKTALKQSDITKESISDAFRLAILTSFDSNNGIYNKETHDNVEHIIRSFKAFCEPKVFARFLISLIDLNQEACVSILKIINSKTNLSKKLSEKFEEVLGSDTKILNLIDDTIKESNDHRKISYLNAWRKKFTGKEIIASYKKEFSQFIAEEIEKNPDYFCAGEFILKPSKEKIILDNMERALEKMEK
jgi:hypothetical protein